MSNPAWESVQKWPTNTGVPCWDRDRTDLNIAISAFRRAMQERHHALLVIKEVTSMIGDVSDAYAAELKRMKDILEDKP